MATIAATARVDADEVKEIIDTSLSDASFNAHINTAHYIIQEHLLSVGLSANILEMIELWLSAHFVGIHDQRLAAKKQGDWSATYQGKTDMGFEATLYGQQALQLDTSGTLATLGLKKASFTVWSEDDYDYLDTYPDNRGEL